MAPLVSSVEIHETQRVACQREGQEGTFHGEGKSAFYKTQIEKDFADKLYIHVK